MLYYVYMYSDPRPGKDGEVIYIGKGTVSSGFDRFPRAYSHWRRGGENPFMRRVLAKIKQQGLEPDIRIYRIFRNEQAAFDCERTLIQHYGFRCDGTGTLLNLEHGGRGGHAPGSTGSISSSRTMQRLWRSPGFAEKVASGVSAASKRRWSDPEESQRWSKSIRAALALPEEKARRSKASSAYQSGRSAEQRCAQGHIMLAGRHQQNLDVVGMAYGSYKEAAAELRVPLAAVFEQRKLEKRWFEALEIAGFDLKEYWKLAEPVLRALDVYRREQDERRDTA